MISHVWCVMTNPASGGDDRAGYRDTTGERGAVETGYIRYANVFVLNTVSPR